MNLRIQGLVLLLLTVSSVYAGRTVTDGFQSVFVRPSPDRPDPDPNPCFRFFDVYLPDEFDSNPEMTFPIVYHLTGLGGNYTTFSEPDRLVMDKMLANKEVVPMIIVAPDPRVLNYDGSFWTDSNVVQDPTESFNNNFERYFIEELIPFVDQKYRQKKDAQGNAAPFRALMGQSMGGYGSLLFGIKHPELFDAYAGDSPTAFWLINTNLASPPEPASPQGSSMFSFNKLLIPGLVNSRPAGRLTPDNDDVTFGFFSWAAAFSPLVKGIEPSDCSFNTNSCLLTPPFCVAYPFNVGPDNVPQIVGGSFVENPAILQIWEQRYDPYVILDTFDPKVFKNKAIYFDAGDDLVLEIIDNVGSRYFSDKFSSLDVDNEYLLYKGGHTSCTTIDELPCYRFTTNLKLFSGKFAEAGNPPSKTVITGTITLEMADNSRMSITDKAVLAIETEDIKGIPSSSNVTLQLQNSARLEIGTDAQIGGGLQVGNSFGKANLLFDPARVEDRIRFTLAINGPQAVVQIGKQGFLGWGVGVTGNTTDVANYWGLSSLTNVDSVDLLFMQGRFEHNQIASSLEERGSLVALGKSKEYNLFLNAESFVISGGANLATITEANRIHPTVQDTAGTIDPGGIRNRIIANPSTEFDDFYGAPKGVYASRTFSENLMKVGILSSSLMLFDADKQSLATPATQEELFTFLSVANYFDQGRKRAPINELDGRLVVGYIVPQTSLVNGQETTSLVIKRVVVNKDDPCNPLSIQFSADRILQEGAVGISLARINGTEQIVRLFDLNPLV
jgi:hypothetical protein